ncbi:MAG: hypothetical protein HYT36_00890 [Candidatus Staskawiczbacteria bacterium]|nr:hypothetical protein [Candidatus Staskawiczbacteria bacterium]
MQEKFEPHNQEKTKPEKEESKVNNEEETEKLAEKPETPDKLHKVGLLFFLRIVDK